MTKKYLKISVLSFLYITLVLHGLQRMSGLFIIELSKGTESINHQDAAIPFIYSWAVAKIVASFSDFLIDDKSSELVVFCGVLLCSMGAALCILDTDITAITVFWGFIFGSGYGLASPHLTRNISNEDSSKLSFFKEVPSSFGICIMPFLLDVIILQYGLQGSFIIFSGIILQYVPFALAAAYNIEIRIPNIKWRVRKKSNQYFISKQEGKKTASIESFNNSLEPDFVLNVNQCDDYYKTILNSPVTSSKEAFSVARRRSETKGNDLQGLETDRKMLQKHKINYPTVPELEHCEENGEISQENFSNMQVIDVGSDCKGFKNHSILNSGVTHNICASYRNNKNTNEHDFDLKNKISENKISETISQNGIKETDCLTEELDDWCLGNNASNKQKKLSHPCTQITTDKENECNKQQISESVETEKRISFTSKQAENTSSTSHTSNCEKLLDKETPLLSLQSLQSTHISTIPIDIKVHIEEYTFAVDREYRSNSFDSNDSGYGISDEISYSQSRFMEESEYLKYANQNVPCNILKDVDSKANSSNIYSVSNTSKFDSKNKSVKSNKGMGLNISKDELKLKFLRILKFFNSIISPVCLCIVLITIIFETGLITLLTNISDFVNNTDRDCCDFTWILVAFGVGGLFGKLCCYKISRTISEKSHTAGVILFLLTGLSIAGVLYSPNLSWLAGFYSILGALEGGISYILPKFILDYTHKDVHHVISSTKNFLSGVSIICLPSVLGLLPDEMGDYEFLLQTLSCLSILCAFLVYFLPYLRSISNKGNIPSFKNKMDRV